MHNANLHPRADLVSGFDARSLTLLARCTPHHVLHARQWRCLSPASTLALAPVPARVGEPLVQSEQVARVALAQALARQCEGRRRDVLIRLIGARECLGACKVAASSALRLHDKD